jgi:hypothetical protein
VAELVRELDDHDLGRLLLALGDALNGALGPSRRAELQCFAQYVLGAISRGWHKKPRPLPVFLLEAWYSASARFPEPLESPPIRVTWHELHPSPSLLFGDLGASELHALDDWLTLAQVVAAHDPNRLRDVGFYDHDEHLLAHLAVELSGIDDPDLTGLAEDLLRRIRELSPTSRDLARSTLTRLKTKPAQERWWVPEDIDAPPSTEPVARSQIGFTRADVERVLGDL